MMAKMIFFTYKTTNITFLFRHPLLSQEKTKAACAALAHAWKMNPSISV